MEQNHIFWRDEILQLLVWLRGEGMGEAHGTPALARFLAIPEESLLDHVSQMVNAGYLVSRSDGFALTDFGQREGARRFREEFEPLLSQGHGECNDPDCDCHQLGPEHCQHREQPRSNVVPEE
jgi:hypothetical protein